MLGIINIFMLGIIVLMLGTGDARYFLCWSLVYLVLGIRDWCICTIDASHHWWLLFCTTLSWNIMSVCNNISI